MNNEVESIWQTLSQLSLGTVVGWIVVIATIISVLCMGAVKIYKAFEKYDGIKKKSEEQEQSILRHDELLNELNQSLNEIKAALAEQKEVNLKQVRHTLVQTCDEALTNGQITAGKLRSLEEMFDVYKNIFNGNGYVQNLVFKVRKLPIVGEIED